LKHLRVLFMGTPEFALPALEALIDGPDEVVGVVTQPDRPSGRKRRLRPPPVKRVAVDAGLTVFQPERLRDRETYRAIAATQPDVCVVVAFGKILGRRYLALPRFGCLNIHASLLPRWRGAAPINWAVAAGDARTGVAVQKMERGLDTGPVVRAWATDIDPLETAGELHDRLAPAGAALIVEVLGDLRAGRALELAVQDDEKATYARLLAKQDGWVSFERSPAELAAHVHGMTPWPGAICQTPRGPLKLLRAQPVSEPSTEPPGTVLSADATNGLRIAAGEGVVSILECQRPGRQAMAAEAYINGLQSDITGERWRDGGNPEAAD
jgi:methionyl-tRNA formyltransferase